MLAAHDALAEEDFTFAPGYRHDLPWPEYLDRLEAQRTGRRAPRGRVPSTVLVADVDGAIVGRASIRHRLDAFHAAEGGHIGDCVLAEHRRRGYATEILRQSVVIARAVGIDRVRVTCDVDNVGSAAVIERGGGVFESTVDSSRGGRPKRRYWIG